MNRDRIIMNTLNAVDQVEVAFNQTLSTINEINRRYEIISGLRVKAEKRQQSYEAEILAAIMEPTSTKISNPQKNQKKKKKCKKQTVKKHQTSLKIKIDEQESPELKEKDDNKFDEFNWEELEKDCDYNSENSDEADGKTFSSKSHYCSLCRGKTIHFNLVY